MNPIRNILVIVDPTAQHQPALEKGALLARKLGARLELFACETKATHEARLAAHAHEHGTAQAGIETFLANLAAPLCARGLEVAIDTERADPLHLALIDKVRRTGAELVIKDTHPHSLPKRTVVANTDWHLIRACPVPLLLSKPQSWADAPRVLAAVDPAHVHDKPGVLDNEIVEYAQHLAQQLTGELHLLHAFLPRVFAFAAAGSAPVAMNATAEDLAIEERQRRKQVETLVAPYGIPSANIHLELGGVADVLPRQANSLRADILVLGAVPRTGLQRALVGCTSEAILERLPCDALIVKPPDFATTLPF